MNTENQKHTQIPNFATYLAAGAAIFLFTGCGTVKPVDLNQAHSNLIQQERTYQSFRIVGPVTIQVQEGGEVVAEAPLAPIRALPQSPDTVGRIVDGTLKGLAIWQASEAIQSGFDAAKKEPVIVDPPEPIIIEPHFAP